MNKKDKNKTKKLDFGASPQNHHTQKHLVIKKNNNSHSQIKPINGYDSYNEKNYISVGLYDSLALGEGDEMIGTESVSVENIVITLYDPETKKGILAHLRDFNKELNLENAEDAVEIMLNKLGIPETSYANLEATVCGEGGITDDKKKRSPKIIASLEKYNIQNIKTELKFHRGVGKRVFLKCETGEVEVYHA